MLALKLIPHLLAWTGMVLVLLRAFAGRRMVVFIAGNAGFLAGAAGIFSLFGAVSESLLFGIIKSALGVSFLLLWGFSLVAIYRSTGRGEAISRGQRLVDTTVCAAGVAGIAGLVAGAVTTFRLQAINGAFAYFIVLCAVALALAYGARQLEKMLPDSFRVSPAGMLSAVVALLLFSSSSLLRLDLFSPMSMKVMKGVHDFVHQFMESILIPDHLFVKTIVWQYIGFLFGKEVGFWGGMIIWFTPALLISLAINFKRFPSVAHIRQGAQRRRLVAAALSARRSLLVTPLLSVFIFGAAAYQSSFPSVEYWDPKPVPVVANQVGQIFIPRKGEVSLDDGKLHKYLFKQGEKTARFFVLMNPEGKFTVDLDACAICKPDGYGQAEGSVICYYCKTLIPLETVGKVGGCNPVPIPFKENADGVVIDSITLINNWSSTVQATSRVKEGGK
jgi:uncharacterized membrane protein